MPRLFTTSSDHLMSTSTAVAARPAWISLWVKRHAANSFGGLYAALYAASNELLAIGEDLSGSSGQPMVYVASGSNTGQVKATSAVPADTWTHVVGTFSSSALDCWINGGGDPGPVGNGYAPSTLTSIRVNNPGTALASISMAGLGIGNVQLSALEASALAAGIDARHIKSCTNFYLVNTASGTENDLVGTNSLAITGTSAASDAPGVSTFMVGGPVAAQSWTAGTAITSIDLSTAGGIFTDTASPYTVTLQQIAATTTTGLTSSSGTNARIVTLTAAMTGLSGGDYVTVGGNPAVRVLSVSSDSKSFLAASNQSWASSATVTRYTVSALSIPGISITSNVVSGTPTTPATYSLCVGRATCNANSTAVADTNTFSIAIASSGGGGGGGGTALFQAAIGFTGGFQGG